MANILIIDDEQAIRRILAQTLEHAGHRTTQAGDGREGLRVLNAGHFDLVITDIVMPEMEGIEVMMEIRKQPSPPALIAMSGGGRMSPQNYLHIAMLLGATRTLTKPFGTEELLAAVNALVPLQAPPSLRELATQFTVVQ